LDGKKKELRGHVISLGISIAAGYFTSQVQLNKLFSLPSYAYTSLSIFVGIWILYEFLSIGRFMIVRHHDSKQIPMPLRQRPISRPIATYITEDWEFGGLAWKVEFNMNGHYLFEAYGPFCIKKECGTELNERKTFFGRYKQECPACSFKKTATKNAYTLRSDLKKVSRAKFNKTPKLKRR